MIRAVLLLAALASAVVAAATVAWLVHREPELTNGWDEPDDGVQPPDPRPVTLASGPLGRPVDATHWTLTGAGHESQTRVGDRG